MKKWIPILIGIMFIAFGIGFYSLIYNDGFKLSDLNRNKGYFNIRSNNSKVQFGKNNMEIRDGESYVNIGLGGIEVRDGDDHVKIGLDGINVNDGKGNKINIGNIKRWFGIYSSDLKTTTVDEEKMVNIKDIDLIKITSSFIDIKVTTSDRDDVKIHYHGTMESNVAPILQVEKSNGELEIKLTTSKTNYTVVNSDVILEVILPKEFKQDVNVINSSGDIYILEISGRRLNFTSSSGDISYNNSMANNTIINSSSGDITIKEISGDVNINSSSGDILLTVDNILGNVDISTASGDVDIFVAVGANYAISGSTASGDIESKGPISINQDSNGKFNLTLGSGEKTFKIKTSSGDVTFK